MLGASLPVEQGGAGVSNVAYGLVMYELERIDSGLRSFASVQSALVMYPIARYGSPEQQRRYLPELGRGPPHRLLRPDRDRRRQRPRRQHEDARPPRRRAATSSPGSKLWITNGGIADVAVIWAKDDDGQMRGFPGPRETPRFLRPRDRAQGQPARFGDQRAAPR